MKWNGPIALGVCSVIGLIFIIIMFSTYRQELLEFERAEELGEGNPIYLQDRIAQLFYSPGEIHQGHFKGEFRCQHCHEPGNTVTSTLCSTCHTENDFIENSPLELIKDTHVLLLEEQSCFDCHTEHKGLRGEISVKLDLYGHEKVIIESLREECFQCHQSEAKDFHINMNSETCADCHKLEVPFKWDNVTFTHKDVEELKIDAKREGFTKLPIPEKNECSSCHEDNFHIGSIDKDLGFTTTIEGKFDCKTCHDFTSIQ